MKISISPVGNSGKVKNFIVQLCDELAQYKIVSTGKPVSEFFRKSDVPVGLNAEFSADQTEVVSIVVEAIYTCWVSASKIFGDSQIPLNTSVDSKNQELRVQIEVDTPPFKCTLASITDIGAMRNEVKSYVSKLSKGKG